MALIIGNAPSKSLPAWIEAMLQLGHWSKMIYKINDFIRVKLPQ